MHQPTARMATFCVVAVFAACNGSDQDTRADEVVAPEQAPFVQQTFAYKMVGDERIEADVYRDLRGELHPGLRSDHIPPLRIRGRGVVELIGHAQLPRARQPGKHLESKTTLCSHQLRWLGLATVRRAPEQTLGREDKRVDQGLRQVLGIQVHVGVRRHLLPASGRDLSQLPGP